MIWMMQGQCASHGAELGGESSKMLTFSQTGETFLNDRFKTFPSVFRQTKKTKKFINMDCLLASIDRCRSH